MFILPPPPPPCAPPRWTIWRQQAFLESLIAGGDVGTAARAAGMSRQGAYKFARSARGAGFRAAWAAVLQARETAFNRAPDAGGLARRILLERLGPEELTNGQVMRRLGHWWESGGGPLPDVS